MTPTLVVIPSDPGESGFTPWGSHRTGRATPGGTAVDGYQPSPVADQGLCLAGANYSTLLKWPLGVPLLPANCAGSRAPCMEGRLTSSATTLSRGKRRASGTGTSALILSSARSLPKPEFRMTAKWMLPGMADALQKSC